MKMQILSIVVVVLVIISASAYAVSLEVEEALAAKEEANDFLKSLIESRGIPGVSIYISSVLFRFFFLNSRM